jgi:hypothetical protein
MVCFCILLRCVADYFAGRAPLERKFKSKVLGAPCIKGTGHYPKPKLRTSTLKPTTGRECVDSLPRLLVPNPPESPHYPSLSIRSRLPPTLFTGIPIISPRTDGTSCMLELHRAFTCRCKLPFYSRETAANGSSSLESSLNTIGLSRAASDSTTSLEEARRRWAVARAANRIHFLTHPY